MNYLKAAGIFFMILFLSGCHVKQQENVNEMSLTFMAGYKPQASLPFVGVYVAQEEGFFEEQKLKVQILHTGGGGEHLQLLSVGKIDVTTQDAAVLLQRRADPGLPLVSIALVGQKGQQAFVALADSQIDSIKDWEGRLVGYRGTPPPDLYALLAAAGVDKNKIELVNVGFDLRIFTERKVDVYPVYKSNEPFMLQNWGYDYTLWDAHDFGVPTLGLSYVTSEEILETKQEMLTRFLSASIKGIEYAIKNPEKAVDIVLKYTGPETDRKLMRFMLDAEIKDALNDNTNNHTIGWQTEEQWQSLTDLLVNSGIMKKIDPESAFSNKLLENIDY